MSDSLSGAKFTAITALRPLFKLTEVLLRDDAPVFSATLVRREASAEEPTALQSSCTTADANSSLMQSIPDCISVEAMELARERDALGLPFPSAHQKRNNHVIAIDIDPQKIDYARHNAAIYGVNDRIDFIQGDFFKLAPYLKGNTVFMSPPWGGPGYSKVKTYDIMSMLKPHNGYHLFKIGRAIASRVVLYLPRNIDINQLAQLSLSVNPPWALEVENNYLNGRLKAITAYFSKPTL